MFNYGVALRHVVNLLSPICRAAFALTKPLKMNMVKRIMGRPRQEECSPQDNALGLMHLRRLFSELCHPPRHMTQKEQEEKLYMMLPVFNRVSHTRGGGEGRRWMNVDGLNNNSALQEQISVLMRTRSWQFTEKHSFGFCDV